MPSLGNAASWKAYRDKAPFTRKECAHIDVAYRRMDHLANRIANSEGKNLSYDKEELKAWSFLLARVFNETEGFIPDSE